MWELPRGSSQLLPRGSSQLLLEPYLCSPPGCCVSGNPSPSLRGGQGCSYPHPLQTELEMSYKMTFLFHIKALKYPTTTLGGDGGGGNGSFEGMEQWVSFSSRHPAMDVPVGLSWPLV